MVVLKRFLQVSVVGVLVWVNSVQACSVQVNEPYIKNEMIAAAANEFRIPLTTATRITLTDYSRAFVGTNPEYDCPLRLESQAQITINYSPNAFTRCELSVREVQSDSMSDELAPHASHTFQFPTSSCTLVRPVRPIRIGR
jgi:hypothetical protein